MDRFTLDIDLDALLAPYVTGGDPGFAAGVYRDGALVADACAGLAVLEHRVPIGTGTVFDIASASKHFTATCLVLLQRDGVLHLDDDVRRHLPELALSVPVTLRQCLSHTGGLREYYTLTDMAGVPTIGMTEARLMRLIAGLSEVDFPPGTGWSYSNTGFVLAAATVRRLTGRSLAEFATVRLFTPLAMRVTRFRDDLAVPVPGIATGYAAAPAGGGWHRADITEEVVGDGGVITSIDDLAAWQHFMLTGAHLGTDVRDALLAVQVRNDGRPLPYALGLSTTTVGGRAVRYHTGSIDGFRSVLAYLIDDGVGVAVLANRTDVYPGTIAMRIVERLTGTPVAPVPTRVDPDTAASRQPSLAGRWHAAETDVVITLDPGDDGTLVQSDGEWAFRYAPMSDGAWHCVEGGYPVRYRLVGEQLWCEDLVGDDAPEVYERTGPPPVVDAPAGVYFSPELRAYATLSPAGNGAPIAGTAGTATITIGLAESRTVSPVSDGVWAGEGLTVRLTDAGDTLLISEYGARRVRFNRVAGAATEAQRGL